MTSLLHKTFPKLDCTFCQLQELINKVMLNSKITILTNSEIQSISGYVGNFKTKIKKNPSYVKDSCTGCGLCVNSCPVSVQDEDFRKISFKNKWLLNK
jgi:heterodisulfide reductase subunit A